MVAIGVDYAKVQLRMAVFVSDSLDAVSDKDLQLLVNANEAVPRADKQLIAEGRAPVGRPPLLPRKSVPPKPGY